MYKKYFIFIIAVVFVSNIAAQQLVSPSFSFSHKKTSHITLTDGTEIQGILKDIDRKDGLIKFVKINDNSGTKHKLKAESIKFMYLPPSGLDNLNKKLDFLTDAQKWNDEKLDQDLLNQGYAYFENTQVKIKKKEFTLLMQLLNPGFSKKVKVYHDPLAKKTASVGVGGLTVAGGLAKSYYLKTDEGPASIYEKKDYKKEFNTLWNKCNKVVSKYTDIKWSELVNHIVDFTECN